MTAPPTADFAPTRLRTRDLWIAVGLGLVAALAFVSSLRHEFVWDDRPVQRELQNGKSVWGDYYADSDHQAPSGYFRPFFLLSYKIDAALYGWDNAAGWRFTSLWLHGLGVALFFLLLIRLGFRSSIALFLAALHAWHPTRVETVCWISARMDLMSVLFLLMCAHATLSALAAEKRGAVAGWTVVAASTLLFSLFSKEMAAGAPLIVLAAAAIGRPSLHRKRMWALGAALFASLALFLVLRQITVGAPTGYPSWAGGLPQRIFYAAQLIARFIIGLVVPWPQNPIVQLHPSGLWAAMGWAMFAGVVLAIALSRSRKALGLMFLAALLFCFPVSQIIPIGFLWGDRFYFLASMPVLMMAGWALSKIDIPANPNLRRAGLAIGVVALGVALTITLQRIPMWKDPLSLWTVGAHASPDSALAALNYGSALDNRDRDDEAREQYRRAIALDANQYMALFNLARLEADAGRAEEALTLLRRIPEGAPAYQQAQQLAVQIFLRSGALESAQQALEAGDPDSAATLFQQGNLEANQGRFKEAVGYYRKAVEADPDLSEAKINMGKCYLELGLFSQARNQLLDVPEDFRDYNDVLFTLANAEAALENYDEAIRRFNQVLERDRKHAGSLYNLMALYEHLGRSEEAKKLWPRVREIKRGTP